MLSSFEDVNEYIQKEKNDNDARCYLAELWETKYDFKDFNKISKVKKYDYYIYNGTFLKLYAPLVEEAIFRYNLRRNEKEALKDIEDGLFEWTTDFSRL